MRIGIVDVDTSHPNAWIPIERELGHEVAGIWDGGSVHPPDYVRTFVEERGVPKLYESLEAMAADVDCAIIHGCDWDTHVDKARPFVEAGKSVLLDKPIAGNLRDLNQLKAWVAEGARISGGSSLRFCREARRWLAQPIDERGTPHTVLCGCAVDDFNYGIHAYAMLAGILGAGAKSVRHLGSGVQRRVQVNWPDGRMGLLIVGEAAGWLPFYATIATEKTCVHLDADTKALYRALLEPVLPYLAGQAEQPPLPFDELIEPELWVLAAQTSWCEGDREVTLDELSEDTPGFDGKRFAKAYREGRYPPPRPPGRYA